MILKAKEASGVWQYFECNQIRTAVHFQLDPPVKDVIAKRSIDNIVWDFTDRPCSQEEAVGGVAEITLYQDVDTPSLKCVFAYRPCYILNNDGRTIERI